MIYDFYRKNETFYEFVKGDITLKAPVTSVILVDDESGLISIKLIATRKTIGLVKKN